MTTRRALARAWVLGALLATACRQRDVVVGSGESTRVAPPTASASATGSVAASPIDTARPRRRRASAARADTPGPTAATCVVAEVSDGDTLRCRDGRRVRLLQIDAPERDQRPYGTEARNALARLAPPGTQLRMELDRRPTDRYGRTLAFLWLPDGRMANEVLVREGYAVPLVYAPNRRYEARIRAVADSARRARRGLHAGSAFACEPVQHRRGAC